jgi:hypothetical protein
MCISILQKFLKLNAPQYFRYKSILILYYPNQLGKLTVLTNSSACKINLLFITFQDQLCKNKTGENSLKSADQLYTLSS